MVLPFIVRSVGDCSQHTGFFFVFLDGGEVKWQKPDLARRPGKVLGSDFIDKIHGLVACMASWRHSMLIQAPGTCPIAYVKNDSFDGEQWILTPMMKVLTETFCSGEASTAIGFREAMPNGMESQIPITLREIARLIYPTKFLSNPSGVLILRFRSLK